MAVGDVVNVHAQTYIPAGTVEIIVLFSFGGNQDGTLYDGTNFTRMYAAQNTYAGGAFIGRYGITNTTYYSTNAAVGDCGFSGIQIK